MTESEPPGPQTAGDAPERAGDARKTRGIRFSDPEWEEVKAAAESHGMPAAEFVRERILAVARDGSGAAAPAIPASLAPLIERTFRYAYILATARRDEMIAAGRGDEIEALGRAARDLEDSLKAGAPERSGAGS